MRKIKRDRKIYREIEGEREKQTNEFNQNIMNYCKIIGISENAMKKVNN